MHRLSAVLATLMLVACAQAETTSRPPAAPASPQAQAWLDEVRAIADAGENAQRRAAIEQRLDALGLSWRAAPFETDDRRGENLLVDLGGPADAPLLLLGAHYDRVETGHGATDNASGSAVVLALAQRLRERPLQRHRVALAFWDLEELGLLGSKAYVADGSTKPALYVNFDVFGWGDTLWMMAPPENDALIRASDEAARHAQLGFSAGERYPPSDHMAFLKADWPAVSYSLLGGDEIAHVLDAYAGKKLRTPPKVMQVIHSARDTATEIEPDAALRGIDAVERALRQWDAAAR